MLWVAAATAARRVRSERGGAFVAFGFYVIVVAVLSGLWRAAADANGGELAGYSAVALTWYIAASEAATVALNIRMIEVIGDDIASGAIASELLRPASVLGVRIASEVGTAVARLVVLLVAGVLLCTVVAGPPPSLAGVVLAVPSLLLAISCNLLAQHAVAAAAFWVRDARSTWFLYQKLVFVLGGMLIPLEVLPEGVHRAALAMPFMAMAYAPARLASGHVEPWLLVTQAGWVAVLGVAARAAFTAGERRLQVVGG